jgi:hypothetical protein
MLWALRVKAEVTQTTMRTWLDNAGPVCTTPVDPFFIFLSQL